MSRFSNGQPEKNFVERRKGGNRRKGEDRRLNKERRHDFRDKSVPRRRTLRIWVRSLARARLGVDRRKGERRSPVGRRQQNLNSLLSHNEIYDLLSL